MLYGVRRKLRTLREMRITDIFNYRIAKTGTKLSIRVHGVGVNVRRGTPDLAIARESLGAEFDIPLSYFSKDYDGLIIDAGGYIGTAAIKFARALPRATIVTIEPSPINFQILKENTAAYHNVKPIQAALGTQQGRIKLRDRGKGQCGFTTVANPSDAPNASAIVDVKIITLGQILEECGESSIGLLKLDIEGAELELLREAGQWMHLVKVLVVELHERVVPGVEELYFDATQGRTNSKMNGEKFVSALG